MLSNSRRSEIIVRKRLSATFLTTPYRVSCSQFTGVYLGVPFERPIAIFLRPVDKHYLALLYAGLRVLFELPWC
jgi:hypothetical protein